MQSITEIHATRQLIESTRKESLIAPLTVRERDFLRCLVTLAARAEFSGITAQQHGWLSAIAKRLNDRAARGNARSRYARGAYMAACFGR